MPEWIVYDGVLYMTAESIPDAPWSQHTKDVVVEYAQRGMGPIFVPDSLYRLMWRNAKDLVTFDYSRPKTTAAEPAGEENG